MTIDGVYDSGTELAESEEELTLQAFRRRPRWTTLFLIGTVAAFAFAITMVWIGLLGWLALQIFKFVIDIF